MSESLIAEDFEALAGTEIRLAGGDGTLVVELKEVRKLQSPSPRTTPPFAVVLRERGATRTWTQGMYRVDLGARGPADIFVVPIGPDGEGMCYEAVFN